MSPVLLRLQLDPDESSLASAASGLSFVTRSCGVLEIEDIKYILYYIAIFKFKS